MDSTCPVCHQGPETICHMLFHCQTAKEVWEASRFPLPQAGWSLNSVFLNLHHLISTSQKQSIGASVRLSFPWLLWQIWKARNKLCFEQVQSTATDIVSKATEEAVVWLNLHGNLTKDTMVPPDSSAVVSTWSKPPPSFLKCNVGASWSTTSSVSGAGWIIRNSTGRVLSHSRRALRRATSSFQAHLMALSWASAAVIDLKLKNVVFEFSSPEAAEALNNPLKHPSMYHLCQNIYKNVYSSSKSGMALVSDEGNVVASAIAVSVTRDHRLQSYVATGGPRWLSDVLVKEATAG